ncbi:Fanconi anemia group D2 protein homolog [Impatiens glandulifera]|uniref:Fanconi anemia group D2 protein homolog n=1 Tax=Impatiens glandulifera TaxID=253017 RepID=UPI001FB14A57|nr:Fanconi anemia group D2 protein homolog [Impatiens glandulifera]XP_047315357.1 Fanconi anemia group D2 protein homolog [Impatiens glandulifera]
MVLLNRRLPSRKRPSSTFVPPLATPPKILKTDVSIDDGVAASPAVSPPARPSSEQTDTLTPVEKMASILADAGCTLINPAGPPCLPSDLHNFRARLHRNFSSDSSLRNDFLSAFSTYLSSPNNFRRVLSFSNRDGSYSGRNDSLVRVLLLVPCIQLDLQVMLLEKLPEYFDDDDTSSSVSPSMPRLILNQFRWLDFLVDSEAFSEKLLQILSVCPVYLKKELIGSLPEIIGNQSNKLVVSSLDQMLQDDSSIILPVLDSFSNLNLDDQLQDQAITIALSCIRTIDSTYLPCLLRFLFLSATSANARRVITQVREHLKLVGLSTGPTQNNKLKGMLPVDNVEASILDTLRSSLRFKSIICSEILKELGSLKKARDHKVIDIWLLMLIYMNGESFRKNVEKMFKKKIAEGCIVATMFDQCIYGKKEFVQEYFPAFLSLSEFLLACKEEKMRDFGIHIYTLLFKEFVDTYSRQEVLSALVSHVGSGIVFEVSSALDSLFKLASLYPDQLIPLASHINGIFDYLEAFTVDNLHKVYEIFTLLAHFERCSKTNSFRSSIADELLMIVRKQVSSTDLKYKKMGIIGTLRIIACFGEANNRAWLLSQNVDHGEALELLKVCLNSCQQLSSPLILLYDELISLLNQKTLNPSSIEWITKHAAEFESTFLLDLEKGQLPNKDLYCCLEGELWMNLDGDISPICLNILPMVSSSQQSSVLLQVLPAKFLLLSTIERLMNQGNLSGIDAVLGCPLHLPSSKIICESSWNNLSGKQKQVICLSLYYAINWIRELLNAFCTQVGKFNAISQTMKVEIISKLMKRLRNLVVLEGLLNNCLKLHPMSLPELSPHMENSAASCLTQPSFLDLEKRTEHMKNDEVSSTMKKKKSKKVSKETTTDANMKVRQMTVVELLRKANKLTSQAENTRDSSGSAIDRPTDPPANQNNDSSKTVTVDISAVANLVEAQRYKFRPLDVGCFSILGFSMVQNQDSDCVDSAIELPLHLYLLRELHYRLDAYYPPNKQLLSKCLTSSPSLRSLTRIDFLSNIRPLFPSLRTHLCSALDILTQGIESDEHFDTEVASFGIPNLTHRVVLKSAIAGSVFKEALNCFIKIINLPGILIERSMLSDLLGAFQPREIPCSFFSEMKAAPLPGSINYLYCGAYYFLEELLESGICKSFMLASEVLFTLESLLISARNFLHKLEEENDKRLQKGLSMDFLPKLDNRLSTSASKILKHGVNSDSLDNSNDNGWKSKGERVGKILHIYLVNSDSTSDLLEELACYVLPQVPTGRASKGNDAEVFPALSSATFLVWYRVLQEENLVVLKKLIKEVTLIGKPSSAGQPEDAEVLLKNLEKSVNVVVSLVNLCRIHEKITVHAVAIKYGGNFMDCFLKVFDFLQSQFQSHSVLIIKMVRELQKATRTLQTLCSEAKGLKQTAITRKIPVTKRSLESFLFHVKALLHTTTSGCTFWMGNLKHKDLMGQVVSSQVYLDCQDDGDCEDGVTAEEQPISVDSCD